MDLDFIFWFKLNREYSIHPLLCQFHPSVPSSQSFMHQSRRVCYRRPQQASSQLWYWWKSRSWSSDEVLIKSYHYHKILGFGLKETLFLENKFLNILSNGKMIINTLSMSLSIHLLCYLQRVVASRSISKLAGHFGEGYWQQGDGCFSDQRILCSLTYVSWSTARAVKLFNKMEKRRLDGEIQ